MTTGRELARPEDLRAAAAEITEKLRQGDSRGAETAMALYVPQEQALVVRTTFLDAMARRPGESQADALRRAGRETERVLDTVPDVSAPEVVAELDPQVLGAVLAAAAGESTSTVAQLVDPARIEQLLATSLELWTVARPEDIDPQLAEATGEGTGMRPHESDRVRGLNVDHLVHVLWTIFQTDDERALQLLAALNADLVAYPIARALLRVSVRDAEAVLDEEQPDDPFEAALHQLRCGEDEGPESLGIEDGELRDLLDRIFALGRDAYQRIIRRAQAMDLHEVREELMRTAEEHAIGEEASAAATGADEMFAPLDPPKVG